MHIQLNSRQTEILIALLASTGFITISEIARQLYLSPRTVRYNLPKIRLWLEEQNINLLSKRGLGIFIDCGKTQKSKLVNKLTNSENKEIYITPERRQRIIFLELLLTQEGLYIKDFSKIFGISRTAIHNTLLKITKAAESYHLRMEKSKKDGIRVIGEERHLRYAIANTLMEEIKFSTWKEIWVNAGVIDSPPYMFENTKKLLEGLEFDFCKKIIVRFEQGLGYEFSIYSRFFVTIFIAVSIYRINHGNICGSIPANILDYDYFPQSSNYLRSILSEKIDMELPSSEIDTIKATLYCAEPQTILQETQNQDHQLFRSIATEVISEIAFYLHPSLKIDSQLEKDLANHFSKLFFNLFLGYPLINPYLKNIQNLYPDIYKIAVQASKVLNREFAIEIPTEESAHLTLLFAAAMSRLQNSNFSVHNCLVICNEPLPVRIHLFSSLQKEFPNLNILEADNDPVIFNKQMEEVELVISTTTISVYDKPVVQINPIPSENDWEAIRKWQIMNVHDRNNIKLITSDKRSILDIISKDFITIEEMANDWSEAISLAGNPLVFHGRITNKYLQAVEGILKTYGPFCYIAPNIILLHAKPTDGVISLSLGMLLLRNGVDFGNKIFDPVDIIFLLAAPDDFSHIYALGQLISLSKDKAFIEEIRSAKNSQEIMSVVWNHSVSN